MPQQFIHSGRTAPHLLPQSNCAQKTAESMAPFMPLSSPFSRDIWQDICICSCQWKAVEWVGWVENIFLFANLWKANIAVLLPRNAKYNRSQILLFQCTTDIDFFFFHKEGITKTQETGKSATVIEYGFKGQFFLARPKNHLCKGWLARSLHSELNVNKDMLTVSTFLPGL